MTDVLAELVDWICDQDGTLQPQQVDVTTSMYDAGYIDSMRAADLLVRLEDQYQVVISERSFETDLSSLDRLAAHVSAQLAAQRHAS